MGIIEIFSRIIIELPTLSQLVTDQQIIPFWTGYLRVTSKNRPSFSRVAYLLSVLLNIFYCSKRQMDKTQVKQLKQSSPITYITKYTTEHYNI